MNHAIERIAEESARTQAERAHLNSMRQYAESATGKIKGIRLTPEGRKLMKAVGGAPQWSLVAAKNDRLFMEQQRKQDRLTEFHQKSILMAVEQDYWWDRFFVETDNDIRLLTYRFYRYVDQGLGHLPEPVAYSFVVSYLSIVMEGEGAIDYPIYEFARNLETAKLSVKRAAEMFKGAKEFRLLDTRLESWEFPGTLEE